ncbi:hypothetical protein ALO95_200299 [Pseudomonas syringae pv. antirrhini]|nr:hypothetical protein ALQ23_200140 [Pseudomonas syringae pv. antirrhini]RMW25658.1 hypothetical protein ALO95_200299 [Pseudomonas syringae pv. antirrhini]
MFRTLLRSTFSKAFLSICAVIAVAVFVNLVGIQKLGGIEAWETWRRDAYWYFLAWRLGLYAVLAFAWFRMRRHLLRQEPGTETNSSLSRSALVAVIVLALFELVKADLL